MSFRTPAGRQVIRNLDKIRKEIPVCTGMTTGMKEKKDLETKISENQRCLHPCYQRSVDKQE